MKYEEDDTVKIGKKVICLLLTACMVTGLMPAVSFAAEEKNMQMKTGSISGYDETNNSYDYIYYGTKDGNGIKWRVLDDKANNEEEGGESKGLFLLSDELLGSTQFNPYDNYNNIWQGSAAQDWCNNTFFKNNLTTAEQSAVMDTQKTDEAYLADSWVQLAKVDNILNGDKIFFLSAEEAWTEAYGFTSADSRKMSSSWWLRSPYSDTTNSAGYVGNYGNAGIM